MILADRLLSHFVAPVGGAVPARRVGPTPPPPAAPAAIAVLGEDAIPTGVAMASALARAAGGPALLCVWRSGAEPPPAVRPPATPAASRLAARLESRDHVASAAGRVVRVELPADDAEAAAAAGRAAAAAGVPSVLALAGPRTEALDRLLTTHDAVVLAPRGDTAAALLDAAEPTLRATLVAPVLRGPAAPDRRTRRALARRATEVRR